MVKGGATDLVIHKSRSAVFLAGKKFKELDNFQYVPRVTI